MAVSKTRTTTSFSGKSGLLFHRNMIDGVTNFSDKLSQEFEQKYGIPVKFYFDKRNMGEFKLKFRPKISASKLKSYGIADLKGTLKSFILKKLPSIDSFIMKAIHDTIGKPIMSAVTINDSEGKETTTNWINDKKLSSDKELKLK